MLLSDAAAARLEDLAQVANRLTVARFGRTMRLFAPLYLSNECVSTCTYCGFSAGNDIARRTLSIPEVEAEAGELHRRGFRHLLLVAGEHARVVNREYLIDCVQAVAPHFAQIGIEVQVWDTDTYARLLAAGCDGVTVYQETYDVATYASVHLKGKKRNYTWRLAAPDRAAEAGMRRLAIGALLGLHPDWRSDAMALAAHAEALMRRWWRCEVSVSLPRLRPAAGGYEPVRSGQRCRAGPVGVRAAHRACPTSASVSPPGSRPRYEMPWSLWASPSCPPAPTPSRADTPPRATPSRSSPSPTPAARPRWRPRCTPAATTRSGRTGSGPSHRPAGVGQNSGDTPPGDTAPLTTSSA